MAPTTTDRDPGPTRAAACTHCGTTGGRVEGRCTRPWRRQGYCDRCYSYKRQHGLIANGPDHPAPLPAVVTPAMLGITPGEIGKHYFTAQAQLWADEAACILAGAQWRQRHPEQFAPDHLARIFGGGATHAFWREDAAAAA